jgi:tRNA(Ile)-lysidine synthase TilS/MesJ
MSQLQTGLEICSRCILPNTYPGIRFDDNGICNHCRQEESMIAKSVEKKREYRKKLDELILAIKGKAPNYDAIMAYSGGKDSSYTLKILKERYDLRMIALTFDNHFVSPVSWENIQRITDSLQIDRIRFTPPWTVMKSLFALTARKDIFPAPTLLRASSICTACIGFVKSLVLKTALEMSIPLVAFGWSPGQAPIQSAIMRTNPAMIRQNQSVLMKAFPPDMIQAVKHYFIPEGYYDSCKERFPENIHPLAFFDYDEEEIGLQLEKLGWKAPADTDTNSSNCLLNALANHCHLQRHAFHPYVYEIANMVRQGVMSREDGIKKIYTEQNPTMVKYAEDRLGL